MGKRAVCHAQVQSLLRKGLKQQYTQQVTRFTVQDKVKEGEIVIEHTSNLKYWHIFVLRQELVCITSQQQLWFMPAL